MTQPSHSENWFKQNEISIWELSVPPWVLQLSSQQPRNGIDMKLINGRLNKEMWQPCTMKYHFAKKTMKSCCLQLNRYGWKPLCLVKWTSPPKDKYIFLCHGNRYTDSRKYNPNVEDDTLASDHGLKPWFRFPTNSSVFVLYYFLLSTGLSLSSGVLNLWL